MITKQELIKIASTKNISLQVVEKDYVISWILWGINNHQDLKDNWVFKGGTCLKKCYFGDYRFSEDCDFTLKLPEHLNNNYLKSVFSVIGEKIYDATGLIIPAERISFETYNNPSTGKTICNGVVYYRGPASPSSPQQFPRIKIDLTAHEILVDEPVLRKIIHSYSDAQENPMYINCYSYPEIFAEKIRALSERTRPRDLYDVISLLNSKESKGLPTQVKDILVKKCQFKNIPMPTTESLEAHKTMCKAGWGDQLSHQLPELYDFESYWKQLPKLFQWLRIPDNRQ